MADILAPDEVRLKNISAVRRLRSRGGPFLFIGATADVSEQFQEIVAIDNIDYLTQAVQLTALFNGAINNETGRFESNTARQLIADFNASLPESDRAYKIGIFKSYQTTLTQTHSVVSGMIDKIVEALKQVLGVALGTSTVAQLTAAVTDAFTDLKSQEGDAWIFWEKKTAEKTTYSYAILFAIQDSSTGMMMFAMPMSLLIEVNVSYEKVLWITIDDTETYSVTLDTMKVGQILFPPSPGSSVLRQALAPPPRKAELGKELEFSDITDIQVTNWSKTKTFATAKHGSYVKEFHLEQVMAFQPEVLHPLQDEDKCLVSFTRSGERKSVGVILNGTLPDGTLWFVSQ
ncbi:hypothetical protein [Ensifer aridi]|uniref:hypothetical protein n=1 Tax=Ensifer aridi TaxID=1708715 RepID=UPI0009BE1524|nr:hypothetical protein [Ensifer aridi]